MIHRSRHAECVTALRASSWARTGRASLKAAMSFYAAVTYIAGSAVSELTCLFFLSFISSYS